MRPSAIVAHIGRPVTLVLLDDNGKTYELTGNIVRRCRPNGFHRRRVWSASCHAGWRVSYSFGFVPKGKLGVIGVRAENVREIRDA